MYFSLGVNASVRQRKYTAVDTLRERKFQRTKVPGPGSEKARERIGQETRRPGSERAMERKLQGANWPGSYWPIRSGERIGSGAKRLGTGSKTSR